MMTAIHRVHFKNGPWVTNGGYEYNLVLIAAVLTIAEAGPGPLSVDAPRGVEHGPAWALAALAAGVAASAAVIALARRLPQTPAAAQAEPLAAAAAIPRSCVPHV